MNHRENFNFLRFGQWVVSAKRNVLIEHFSSPISLFPFFSPVFLFPFLFFQILVVSGILESQSAFVSMENVMHQKKLAKTKRHN